MNLFKEISEHYLFASLIRFAKVVNSPKSHARKRIMQKNGKERVVFCPCAILKLAQKYVVDNYLQPLKNHSSCISYTKNKSILDMVRPHVENKYFLHLDIKHYFDFMDWNVFKSIISNYFPSSELNIALLEDSRNEFKKILTFRNKFIQGSVSSPSVSNLYLYAFDCFINRYVTSNLKEGKYTRYSDDIIISSSEFISDKIIDVIKNELTKYRLKLNYKKIKFVKLKQSIKIVGITLKKNGEMCLSTEYKRNVKTMIYKALNDDKYVVNYNKLFGYLYFMKMCDSKYLSILDNKYGKCGKSIIATIKEKEDKQNSMV